MIGTFARQLTSSIGQLIIPSLCLHCGSRQLIAPALLCSVCSDSLTLLIGHSRCLGCFQQWEGEGLCYSCEQHPPPYDALGAAVAYQGAATTIVNRMKYGAMPTLAQPAAAMMAVAIDSLDWPLPDVLVPVPMSWPRKLLRSYNQSELLANELGKVLAIPVVNALARSVVDLPQAGLDREQRRQMRSDAFWLKRTLDAGKRILVIDDVTTSGTTLRRCCERLLEARPKQLRAMAFALA